MFKKAARNIVDSKKEDLDSILKKGLEKQREEVAASLKLFCYFEHWPELTIKETCSVSNVTSYTPNKLVLDGTKGSSQNYTYFILEGSCYVIHRLRVRSTSVNGLQKYSLINQNADEAAVTPKSENVYMQTSIFRAGACFGLGENLKNKWIIASNSVKCLRIPLHVLMVNNRGNVWCRIRQFLDMHFPSVNEMFDQFVAQRKWLEFRSKNYIQRMRRMSMENQTSFHDVPYYCRVYNELSFHQQPPMNQALRLNSRFQRNPERLSLKAEDIALLENQNELYENFLDNMAQIRLRSIMKNRTTKT